MTNLLNPLFTCMRLASLRATSSGPGQPGPLKFGLRTAFGSRVSAFGLAAAVLLACLVSPLAAQEKKRVNGSAWEGSIVTVEVTRKLYDYYQPWAKRTRRLQKVGTVVGDRQILTTADEMYDRTLVRLQKHGRGRWYIGEITWIDYHANLALVTTSENEFWGDLKPVRFGTATPESRLQIVRWHDGNVEHRSAEFTQFSVREGQLSPINHVVLETSSDLQGGGWAEPIVADSQVVGILTAQENRTGYAMPGSFIQSILDARAKGAYHGLGYFHFVWQQAENPASLTWLHQTGEPRGVIVADVPPRPDACEQILHPKDVILQIDGFDVDVSGDYEDPEFGNVMIENLSTRNKWAGDEVKISILRDGKPMEVAYRLPKYDYANALVPYATYDQEPEYLIVGGLVFQPLTDSYLQSWGNEWKRRSPFRLYYYNQQQPTPERPALVLLSQVLPDAYNIGYQDLKWLVLDKVNGQRVSRLPDLRAALQKPINGYHVIEFVQSDSLRRLVLGAGEAEQTATTRVLKRYGISEGFHFARDGEKK